MESYVEHAVDFILHIFLEAFRMSVQIPFPTVAKKTRFELSLDVLATRSATISETSRGRFFGGQGGDSLIECGYHCLIILLVINQAANTGKNKSTNMIKLTC